MSDYDTFWCKRMFAMMALKGVWGVPRSGLVFQKTSLDPPTLTLMEIMPYANNMPINSEKELRKFQREDLGIIRQKFKGAGITIEGEVQ